MTILVDIDSTITNFGETLLLANNQLNNTNYQYTDITSYDWFDSTFNNPWKPTNYQAFWNTVEVNPAAVTAIERWVRQDHQVYLCTASHFNNMLSYKIKRTLEPFSPELINERNIVITQDKSIIRGDVMVDDCIENLYNFNGARICYAQPWNQHYSGSIRFSDWDKINDVIQDIQSIYFYLDEDIAF